MMVFWIGLNILATEALRTLLGTDVPAWAVLLASSGPLYVVAMPLSMLAFTRVPVIRTQASTYLEINSNFFIVCGDATLITSFFFELAMIVLY